MPSTLQPADKTIADVMVFFAVSERTVRGWIADRKISFIKLGGAYRFTVADLTEFALANRFPCDEESAPTPEHWELLESIFQHLTAHHYTAQHHTPQHDTKTLNAK